MARDGYHHFIGHRSNRQRAFRFHNVVVDVAAFSVLLGTVAGKLIGEGVAGSPGIRLGAGYLRGKAIALSETIFPTWGYRMVEEGRAVINLRFGRCRGKRNLAFCNFKRAIACHVECNVLEVLARIGKICRLQAQAVGARVDALNGLRAAERKISRSVQGVGRLHVVALDALRCAIVFLSNGFARNGYHNSTGILRYR